MALETYLLEGVDYVVALEFVTGCDYVQTQELVGVQDFEDWGVFLGLALGNRFTTGTLEVASRFIIYVRVGIVRMRVI